MDALPLELPPDSSQSDKRLGTKVSGYIIFLKYVIFFFVQKESGRWQIAWRLRQYLYKMGMNWVGQGIHWVVGGRLYSRGEAWTRLSHSNWFLRRYLRERFLHRRLETYIFGVRIVLPFDLILLPRKSKTCDTTFPFKVNSSHITI